MYGLRLMPPHSPQVLMTLALVTLTLWLIPGIRGMRHSLQYAKSFGMSALVFWQMRSASVTYLCALSFLPSTRASFERRVSIAMRSSAILAILSLDMRRLDICVTVTQTGPYITTFPYCTRLSRYSLISASSPSNCLSESAYSTQRKTIWSWKACTVSSQLSWVTDIPVSGFFSVHLPES